MLVLVRRTHQKVHIGDDVVIEILGVQGNQVRFGITAPKNIPIHREEVYERIKREQQGDESDGEEPVTG